MIELIEKIEGEAKLDFSFKNNKIDYVGIEFMSTRHIENILQNKPLLDALVINPRVCGICGHAHLIATVQAIENCFENLELSNKAKLIRELTLNFELIQNHFKWFYLVVFPLLGLQQNLKNASYPTNLMGKAIATVGGQYPHNSYAIPGGISSEILPMDLINLNHLIDETLEFYVSQIADVNLENFLTCENIENVEKRKGDLPKVMKLLKQKGYEKIGKSYDRFITFGENSYFKSGKAEKTRVTKNLDLKYVEEFNVKNSYAKNVMYKEKYYEVGPLSRAMMKKTPLIKDSHRRYADSIFSRIVARVCEIAQLLVHSKELIKQIDISEPSYIKPNQKINELNAHGESAVEAARGSLIHKLDVVDGKINNYEIITPTQWNLANGTKDNLGISQKAMLGLEDIEVAKLVFKSFDVCSVCTTH